MEHIAEALRKAGEPRSDASTEVPFVRRRRGRHHKFVEPLRITYDKTRTVNVAPDVLENQRVIAGFTNHPQADTYRILRSQILRRLADMKGNSLGIVSPNSGDGKTLTAANLAVSMAMVSTHTVLLVDLDLRRSKVHEYFGLGAESGVSDYLRGKKGIPDCLVHPGIDRLVILPAGQSLRYSSEALASPRMFLLIEELRTRYADRLIVFDLPPLLASDDSLVLLPHIDASILVVQEGKTQSGEVQRCLEILQAHIFLGTVLNNSMHINPYPYY